MTYSKFYANIFLRSDFNRKEFDVMSLSKYMRRRQAKKLTSKLMTEIAKNVEGSVVTVTIATPRWMFKSTKKKSRKQKITRMCVIARRRLFDLMGLKYSIDYECVGPHTISVTARPKRLPNIT